MEPLELRGRHVLELELDEVRAVSVGATRSRRRAPGAQRDGAALLGVEPRRVRVVDRRWRSRGAPEGNREHDGWIVPAGRAGDHAREPETAFWSARNEMSGRPYARRPQIPAPGSSKTGRPGRAFSGDLRLGGPAAAQHGAPIMLALWSGHAAPVDGAVTLSRLERRRERAAMRPCSCVPLAQPDARTRLRQLLVDLSGQVKHQSDGDAAFEAVSGLPAWAASRTGSRSSPRAATDRTASRGQE
jgi:hypothetical protein